MSEWYWKCQICETEFKHEAYGTDELNDHAWDHATDDPYLQMRLEDGEDCFDELERKE